MYHVGQMKKPGWNKVIGVHTEMKEKIAVLETRKKKKDVMPKIGDVDAQTYR